MVEPVDPGQDRPFPPPGFSRIADGSPRPCTGGLFQRVQHEVGTEYPTRNLICLVLTVERRTVDRSHSPTGQENLGCVV